MLPPAAHPKYVLERADASFSAVQALSQPQNRLVLLQASQLIQEGFPSTFKKMVEARAPDHSKSASRIGRQHRTYEFVRLA